MKPTSVPVSASILAVVAAVLFTAPTPSFAQRTGPSIGIGFNSMLSAKQGLGLGFVVRGAQAVNSDLSLAFGSGFTGFILRGRDDASYLIDPQFSAILSVGSDRPDQATYLIGGVGGYFPINHSYEGGPTIHGGMGWVRQLYETRLFYEVDPSLIIGQTAISIAIPFRIGVIF